ncbi:MAG TPA: gluconeogenesis factor YvcK family protein [Vicinamibacterales bacterium]|nr:gluconeogenesis factor YvcK family protein [Vicinamibacterales bacterium]
MRLRTLKVGCFGGGTGLPSLLGGLKRVPWINLHAVVTMFDSGGSSGVLRDELGVLPPGDVLKCALTLARNEREARNILLARLPSEHQRLAGHTGGNLLLSMMEQYTGDFLPAVDGLRSLLGCRGHVWPITTERASICAQYSDGSTGRGEVEVDARQVSGHTVERLWLDPPVTVHPRVAETIRSLDAVIIGPGSFFTSLLPIFLVDGCREALAEVRGPIIHVANLLTEGRGMSEFTAGDGVTHLTRAIGRPVDMVVFNTTPPAEPVLWKYAREHKHPMQLGALPPGCELIEGGFWTGPIARHDRARLRAAVWAALARLMN